MTSEAAQSLKVLDKGRRLNLNCPHPPKFGSQRVGIDRLVLPSSTQNLTPYLETMYSQTPVTAASNSETNPRFSTSLSPKYATGQVWANPNPQANLCFSTSSSPSCLTSDALCVPDRCPSRTVILGKTGSGTLPAGGGRRP